MAGLNFVITGDNSQFLKKLSQTQQRVKQTSQQIEKDGNSIEQMFSRIAKGAAAIGLGFSATQLIRDIVRVRGEFQQLEIAFETMLRSKDKASVLMGQLTETAAKTPFDLQSIAQGAKQLLAYGSEAENVVDELKMLGNVASGVSVPLGDLVYLYGTLRSQGRAYTVDIRQFAGRGIPIYKELSNVLGVTTTELNGLIEAGKVGFPEVEKAFKNMTSSGGQFFNLMEKQSTSLTGQISNLGDAWDMMLNEIGTHTQDIASAGISVASSLVENYDKVGKSIAAIAATYGTYKAALLVVRLMENTAATARLAHIKIIQLQTAAQTALNFVTKANPYVLLATAVAGVATAMWALHDSTSAAEKAQQRYNDERQKFMDREEERKRKVEELIRIIQDETETEYSKIKAYEDLEKYSPALVEAYNREQLATLSLADANKKLNEERDKNNYNDIIGNIEKAKKAIQEYTKARQEASLNPRSNNQVVLYTSKIESAEGDLKKWESALNEYNRLKKEAEENAKPVEVRLMEAKTDLKQIEDEFAKAKQKFEEEQKRLGLTEIIIPLRVEEQAVPAWGGFDLGIWNDFSYWQKRYKSQKDKVSDLEKQTDNGKTYKEAYDEAKKEWEAKTKAVEDAKKGSEAKYKKAVEEQEDAEKKFKDLGGIIRSKSQTTKQENTISQQKDRISELERKNATDRIRQQEDLENKVAQSRIDAMDEGFEKEKAQMKLNHKKELQEIGRQRQDYVNAVIQMEKEAFDAKEKLKASNDKNYKPKAFDSSTVSVDTSAFDIMGKEARERQKMEIAKFYQDILSEYQDYITKYNSTREKFAKERDRYKKAGASDTQLKEIDYQEQETLKAIDNEFAAREESFNSWADSVIDLSIEKLRELLNQAYQEMMNMEISDPNNPDLAVKRAKVATLRNALEKKEIEKEVSPGKSIKDWDKLYKVLTDVNDVFEEIGDTVGGTFGEIISLAGGIASSSLQAVGAIKGIGEAASGLDKASAILAAVSAGMKIISGIGGFFKEKFGADYSEYDALKSQYETLIGIWDQLIDKKMEYIDIDYGIEAQKAADEAAKLVNVQIERQRQLIKQLASSGSSAGSHSLGYRINDRLTAEDYERISGLVGEKITAEYQLWDLSSEQMEKLLTDERLVSVLDEVNGEFIEYIQNIADYGNQLEEIAQKEKEALTGIGLDEFKSGYVDLLSDLDSTNEEFADNFEKYLQNAILSSLIANKYKDEIESLYDQWAADSESGGRLTPEEAERLRQEQKELTEQMLADREQLMNDFGWEPSGGTSAQQASSAVKVQASQESVDETNGRLTAIQETGIYISDLNKQQLDVLRNILLLLPNSLTFTEGNTIQSPSNYFMEQFPDEGIKTSMLQVLFGVNTLVVSATNILNTLSEIRNIVLNSGGYLYDIAECNKKISKFLQNKMDEISGKLDKL